MWLHPCSLCFWKELSNWKVAYKFSRYFRSISDYIPSRPLWVVILSEATTTYTWFLHKTMPKFLSYLLQLNDNCNGYQILKRFISYEINEKRKLLLKRIALKKIVKIAAFQILFIYCKVLRQNFVQKSTFQNKHVKTRESLKREILKWVKMVFLWIILKFQTLI